MKRNYEEYLNDAAQKVVNLSNEKEFADYLEGYRFIEEISSNENILKLTNDLIQIFQVSPNLDTIVLPTKDSRYKYKDSMIVVQIDLWKCEALFNALKQNNTVKGLIIQDQLYVNESEPNSAESLESAIKSLSEMLKVNNNLKQLCMFHDGRISDNEAAILAEGIRESKSLKDFEFSGYVSNESAQSMWQAVQANGKLNDIRIDSLFHNAESLIEIAEFLKINTNLVALRTHGHSEYNLVDIDIDPLIEALSVNKNLTILEIGSNTLEVDSAFVDKFKTLLASNEILTVLPVLPKFDGNSEIIELLNTNKAYLKDAKEHIEILAETERNAKQGDILLKIRSFKEYDQIKYNLKEYFEHIGSGLLNYWYKNYGTEGSLLSDASLRQIEYCRNDNLFQMKGVCKGFPPSLNAELWSLVASYCDIENPSLNQQTDLVGDSTTDI